MADNFKRVYASGSKVFMDMQNKRAPFWKTIGKSDLEPSPEGIFSPQSFGSNESSRGINEDESFAEPQNLEMKSAKILSKTIVTPFKTSGKAIRLSANNKVAFARSIDTVQQDTLSVTYSYLERMSTGVGTGQITLTDGAGAPSASLIVDDPFSFRKNMLIDVWTALGGTKEVARALVLSVDFATRTLTLDTTYTWSDGSIVCLSGILDGVTSFELSKELTGFRAICDTTTYSTTFENIVVADYPAWTGNILPQSGAPINQSVFLQANARLKTISGEKFTRLISNYDQMNVFLATELTKTRYKDGEIKAGHSKLMWGEYEWMVVDTYPMGEIALINDDHFQKFECADVSLGDLDGRTLSRSTNKDNVEGYYVYEGNLGTFKRNAHLRITDCYKPAF